MTTSEVFDGGVLVNGDGIIDAVLTRESVKELFPEENIIGNIEVGKLNGRGWLCRSTHKYSGFDNRYGENPY